MKTQNNYSSVFWAVGIIVIGFLFLFDNFNFLDTNVIWDFISWKLVFVFIAISSFLNEKYLKALAWTIVATVFYFPQFYSQYSINSVFELWPLLLIGIGIKKITQSKESF
jgi:hypothetical protein